MADDQVRSLEREHAAAPTGESAAALAWAYRRAGRPRDAHPLACEALRFDLASPVRELVRPEPGPNDLRPAGSLPTGALRSRWLQLGTHDVEGLVDLGGGLVAARTNAERIALDLLTGEVRWRAPSDHPELECVTGGALLSLRRFEKEAVLRATDAASGAERWELPRSDAFSVGSFALVPLDEERALLSLGGKLDVLDAREGRITRHLSLPARTQVYRLPGDGLLAVGRSRVELFDLDLKRRWSVARKDGACFAADGRAAYVSSGGEVLRLDLATGAELGRLQVPLLTCPVAVAGGRLLCSSHVRPAIDEDDALTGLDLDGRAEPWRAPCTGKAGARTQLLDTFVAGDGALLVTHRVARNGRDTSTVVARDPATGAECASVALTPAVLHRHGARELLGPTGGLLAAGCLVLPANVRTGAGSLEGVVIVDAPRERKPRRTFQAQELAQEHKAATLSAPGASGAELVGRLEAVQGELLRYEKVLLDVLRRSVAAGDVLEGQRLEALKILERVAAARR